MFVSFSVCHRFDILTHSVHKMSQFIVKSSGARNVRKENKPFIKHPSITF